MRIICLPDAGFRIELSSGAIVPARAARSNGRLGAAAARDCPRVLAVRDLRAGSWGCHAQRAAPVQAIALPAHVEESGGYRRVRLDVHGSAAVLIS
jgi:hypothetical protein